MRRKGQRPIVEGGEEGDGKNEREWCPRNWKPWFTPRPPLFFGVPPRPPSHMSLGPAPYLVAIASLLAGASVVHALYKPDLVRGGNEKGEDREREREDDHDRERGRERERRGRMIMIERERERERE